MVIRLHAELSVTEKQLCEAFFGYIIIIIIIIIVIIIFIIYFCSFNTG